MESYFKSVSVEVVGCKIANQMINQEEELWGSNIMQEQNCMWSGLEIQYFQIKLVKQSGSMSLPPDRQTHTHTPLLQFLLS